MKINIVNTIIINTHPNFSTRPQFSDKEQLYAHTQCALREQGEVGIKFLWSLDFKICSPECPQTKHNSPPQISTCCAYSILTGGHQELASYCILSCCRPTSNIWQCATTKYDTSDHKIYLHTLYIMTYFTNHSLWIRNAHTALLHNVAPIHKIVIVTSIYNEIQWLPVGHANHSTRMHYPKIYNYSKLQYLLHALS